jgi:two-component system LytT family response regulator
MTSFKVLVADDEPLARQMVGELLRRDVEINPVVECGDAAAVTRAIGAGDVDIAFLDIEMPQISGLEIARGLATDGPVVVFVTAFGHYAATAFDVKAIDYVLKPFSDQRFLEAVERAKRRVRERRLGRLADELATISHELKEAREPSTESEAARKLMFREGDRSTILDPSEIIWVEAEDYYVLIHSTRGRHMVRASLAALEHRLERYAFVRVHRNALVNLDAVTEIKDGGTTLLLTNHMAVHISRSRRPYVEGMLRRRFTIELTEK